MFLWNNRSLPEYAAGRRAFRSFSSGVRAGAKRLTHDNPEVQAGFFFSLQTLGRSGPHRMIAAVAVAAASTLSFIAVVQGGAPVQVVMPSVPLEFFAIEILVLLSLVAGFRYA